MRRTKKWSRFYKPEPRTVEMQRCRTMRDLMRTILAMAEYTGDDKLIDAMRAAHCEAADYEEDLQARELEREQCGEVVPS